MNTHPKSIYDLHREEQFEAAMAQLKRWCDESRRRLPWRERFALWWHDRLADIAWRLFR